MKQSGDDYHTLPSDTWCVLPWAGSCVQPWGHVQPCVYRDDLGTTSFVEQHSNEALLDLRKSMLAGERPELCSACWKHEIVGLTSPRQYANRAIADRLSLIEKSNPNYYKPRYFELYINNKCNSKCRICKPKFSTAWIPEYESDPEIRSLFNYTDEIEKLVVKYNHINTEQIHELVDIVSATIGLTTLKLLGGEPFYSEQIQYLLECVLARGSADKVRLVMNTNGLINNPTMSKLIGKFHSLYLMISIDASGKLNNYIRGTKVPSAKIYENIRSWLKIPTLDGIEIANTVGILNAFDNRALKAEVNQALGMMPIFSDKLLFKPGHLKLHIMPDEYKHYIDHDGFRTAAFTEQENKKLLAKWAKWTTVLDKSRKESIHDLDPRLGRLYDKILTDASYKL